MPMNETEVARLEAVEANLRTVTDKIGGLMDLILQKDFQPMFFCGHSRLFLPGDYLKEWGRLYGIGLGPDPVSEVLDTDYETAPPEITPRIRSIEQIMHPVRSSRAQVDFIMVAPGKAIEKAVLEIEDPYMDRRAPIVRAKQLKNPRGRLRTMAAAWAAEGGR